jgi:RNA-splicing ligase RtcB
MSMIGVPSMQISREEMKFDPLKFVLQLFPTRFAYHYHRSHGSLAYFDQMEWLQIFTKKNWKLLHHPIWGELFNLRAKNTRLMSDANCRDNHNVVKIQKWPKNKISCVCLLDYLHHELGFVNMKEG